MKPFSIIVAMDTQNGIGKDGQLPWYLPTDLKNFREITSQTLLPAQQNVVIMGRKTWESLPQKSRPLANRINVVLTRRQDLRLPRGVFAASDFEQAFQILENSPFKGRLGEIFVIGGQQVFDAAVQSPYCQKIYVTHILKAFPCDVFFNFPSQNFKQAFVSNTAIENGISYYFAKYVRN